MSAVAVARCPSSPAQACPCDCYGCTARPRQHCNPGASVATTKVPRMSAEDVLRGAWSLVAIGGLTTLAVALAGTYGAWAAGVLLLAAGAAAAVPLWLRKLDRDAAARETAEARKGVEPFRGVPAAAGGEADDEGGGRAYSMPG